MLLLPLVVLCGLIGSSLQQKDTEDNPEELAPTVTIAFLARNAASNLPWFLGAIENLDYPKDRISIWYVC